MMEAPISVSEASPSSQNPMENLGKTCHDVRYEDLSMRAEPGYSESEGSLVPLLDALVLPESAVHDSVKHSMGLPSNLPNIDARKDELRKLLLHLRPAEVRFLQDELAKLKFVTDGVPNLPENVLAKIALDLDILDLFHLQRVSKSWNRAWDIAPVYKDVMRKYFGAYYESYYKSLPNSSPILKEQFERKAKRINSLRHGRYHSLFKLPFSTGNREGEGASTPLYHSGKIARMMNSRSSVLVMNLRNGIGKWYHTPQRVGLLDFELSTAFVVGRSAQNMLYAWSLHDDTIKQVRLPVRPNSYTIHKNRVGVLLSNGEILLWKIGGKLRQLNYTPLGVKQGYHSFKNQAILFNPFCCRDVTVISTFHERISENRYQPMILARSYSSKADDKTNWLETSAVTWKIHMHEDDPLYHIHLNHLSPLFLVVRPITDTGDFSLRPENPRGTTIYLSQDMAMHLTRFNVCEKKFSDTVYLCPPFDHGRPMEKCVWNGMLYIHRLLMEYSWASVGDEVIMGIKPLNEKIGESRRPYTSTDSLWAGEIDEAVEGKDYKKFTWTRHYDDMIHLDRDDCPMMFADNSFAVLFRKEEALIACFDEKDDLTNLGGTLLKSQV